EMVDGGERLGEKPRVAVGDAVHAAAEPDPAGVHGGRGQRRDGLVAVHVAAARRRLLEVVRDREPVEALRLRELPEPAHLVQRAAHVTDVDAEVHGQNLSWAPPPPNRPPPPANPSSGGAGVRGAKVVTAPAISSVCCLRSSEKSGSAVNPARSPAGARRSARSTSSAAPASSAPPPVSITHAGASAT